jgi:ABC-type dipeptide/oligopeptide/nickel transport system permease component
MKGAIRHLGRIAGLILIAGLASAILVRSSPGTFVDERELNQRLGKDSLAALRAQKQRNANIGSNFAAYLRGLAHGDFGYSDSNNAPIGKLIADRAPETLRELGKGLGGGWLIGLALAIPLGRFRGAWLYDAAASASAGLLLSLPAALVAYLCAMAGAASGVVLAIVIAPRIFYFARNLLAQAYGAQHVEMARARGIRERSIFCAHVLPDAAPQLLALAASSVSMAIGAAIPIESICGSPGLGRLAWQAATARDLPLLVNLTMLVTLLITLAMMFSDAITGGQSGRL